MKFTLGRVVGIALLVAIVPAAPIQAQLPDADQASSVTMPAAGTFSDGGKFEGTITINRFEARNNSVVALGFVRGVLSRGGETIGTGVAGEIAWPVAVKSRRDFSSERTGIAIAAAAARVVDRAGSSDRAGAGHNVSGAANRAGSA